MADVTSASAAGPRHLPLSVMAKPAGAACNLDCTYCFFLSKEQLTDERRMSEATLAAHLRSLFDTSPDGDVEVGWQGGEPTLRGLHFFRRAVDLADRVRRPGQRARHTMQTNATLIDDAWAEFLAEHEFLVGVSIDGPAELHDAYRSNKAGRPTHAQVRRGWHLLQRHGVETNILCTVHRANQDHPLDVYRHLRDDLGARWIQFIPIVERVSADLLPLAEQGWSSHGEQRPFYRQAGDRVTSRSVDPEAWGRFLTTIFDEWLARDLETVSVQHFDSMIGNVFGQPTVCVHAPTCGQQPVTDVNGDVYSCDHFVEPAYRLGSITTNAYRDLALSEAQRTFGADKLDRLTAQCRNCPVRWACHGGCPKDRFAVSRDGEPGHNYLCGGYERFFTHAESGVRRLARSVALG